MTFYLVIDNLLQPQAGIKLLQGFFCEFLWLSFDNLSQTNKNIWNLYHKIKHVQSFYCHQALYLASVQSVHVFYTNAFVYGKIRLLLFTFHPCASFCNIQDMVSHSLKICQHLRI